MKALDFLLPIVGGMTIGLGLGLYWDRELPPKPQPIEQQAYICNTDARRVINAQLIRCIKASKTDLHIKASDAIRLCTQQLIEINCDLK